MPHHPRFLRAKARRQYTTFHKGGTTMKFTRLTALALALVMALSLVTVAQADDKPSTWISY